MKKLFGAFLLITLLFSCGSEQEVDESNESTETGQTDSTETSLILEEADYSNDWIEIRESILAADTASLEKFIDTEDTDASTLIAMCQDDWVRDELMDKPYETLAEVDYNGDLVKEFMAEIIEQVDGEEYGSALYLYFKETKEGLRLTSLMAAG